MTRPPSPSPSLTTWDTAGVQIHVQVHAKGHKAERLARDRMVIIKFSGSLVRLKWSKRSFNTLNKVVSDAMRLFHDIRKVLTKTSSR